MNTESIRSFYETNGYYHAKGVFSPDEIRALAVDFDRIVAQLQSGVEEINARWGGDQIAKVDVADSVVIHTHNVQIYSARWHRALLHERFLEITGAMLGPDIILHHSKLFQKPAERGAPFPMHQDWPYFPTVKDTMMAGIIHVSPATDEMGCLRVYPGSHKLGRMPNSSGQEACAWLDQYPLDGALTIEAEPGDVVFFHYFLLHGSKPNRSQNVRKTVLVQMYSGNDSMEDPNGCQLVLQGWNNAASRSVGERILSAAPLKK